MTNQDLFDALEAAYLTPLKVDPELFIGVELEFPLVNLSGQATDTALSKALFSYLTQEGFVCETWDADGYPVSLREPQSGDNILFECSYNTIEFAFAKAKTIQEIEERFQAYLELIQPFLMAHGHAIQGRGIHPNWDNNDNTPVKLPRYEMLFNYLTMGRAYGCHPYVDYGAFICGNQVQLDVSRDNYLRVLNAFNKIEPVKAYLFPNSPFPAADWDTTIARDRFWEDSLHGLLPENVGPFPRDFQDQTDFLTYLSQTAMFTVTRGQDTYYFPPISVDDYLQEEVFDAYRSPDQKIQLRPQLTDLDYHRPYHYQLLTRRGTVECRSVCAQPLDQTFVPIAFQVGLLENLAELETYLASCDFYREFEAGVPALRRHFSRQDLADEEVVAIRRLAEDVVALADQGLRRRHYGEESYLSPLLADLSR